MGVAAKQGRAGRAKKRGEVRRAKKIFTSAPRGLARRPGPMREGAFALIDCLGFKGIWKRGGHGKAEELREYQSLLLKKLLKIAKEVPGIVEAGAKPYRRFSDPVVPYANILSDSVAISVQYDERSPPKGRYKNYLAWLACESTLKVLDRFRRDHPALVLRGCVTYGEHVSRGNFIVGPAVDDAAEGMDIAQGAFVWLHPTAADKYRHCIKTTEATVRKLNGTRDPEQSLLVRDLKRALAKPLVVDPYDMPLKAGGRLRCPVLNPFAFHRTEAARQEVKREFLEAISGNQLDVLLKHQYTADFLEEAIIAREAHLSRHTKFIDSLG